MSPDGKALRQTIAKNFQGQRLATRKYFFFGGCLLNITQNTNTPLFPQTQKCQHVTSTVGPLWHACLWFEDFSDICEVVLSANAYSPHFE